jgi:iron(III) transport system substrate-binding protein
MLYSKYRAYAWSAVSTALAALVCQAAIAAEVVLYSSNNVETVNRVVDLFTQEHPDIKVSVVRAGTGTLMQRIKAEAKAPLGDIFWSGGVSTLSEFRDRLEPYNSPQAGFVAHQYREPSGLWLGTNIHVIVLMINERQVAGGQWPKGWADLADPKWNGRLVLPDPERSSASFVALYGMEKLLGRELLGRIARNATIVGTTSAAYEGVAKGEFSVAVTMEYAAYEYVAGGLKEIRLVYPSEGTFLSPEAMGLIKNARHPVEARKLYEFLASRKAHTEVFKAAYRRPLRTDVDVSTLSDLPALSSLKIVALDDAQMGADRARFLAQWRQMVATR